MRNPGDFRIGMFFVCFLFLFAFVSPTVGAEQTFPTTITLVPVQNGPVAGGTVVSAFHPERVLVKLKTNSLERSTLGIAVRRGFAADGPLTGLTSLDMIGRQVGLRSIARSTIEVARADLDASLGISRWFQFRVPRGVDILRLAESYAADPNVESATPDWRAIPATVPNDPVYPDQWGHENTAQMLDYCTGCGGHPGGSPVGVVGFDSNTQQAWDASQGYGSASVVIAILDSGVDAVHPDLLQVAGWDYGSGDSNPHDDSASPGHGTACAGVAAATAQNNLGPAGVAGGSSIMPLKVADNAGSLFFSAIQNALYHAADNGADVASMSFGAAISSDPATDTALVYAYNAGVTLLAATGNENAGTISYPAIHANVIAVGAASPCDGRKRSSSSAADLNPGVSADPNGYTCDGERWWGSNYGTNTQGAAAAVDIIAPTIVPTTDISGSAGYEPGDYNLWFNGTSAATPYAAGVAGLIISANPTWTPDQVRDQMRSTAIDVNNVESGAGWDRYSGFGLVDAEAAVGGGGGGGGPTYATLPYNAGFESGALDSNWTTASTSDGRVRTLSTNTPHGGSFHLTMDDPTRGGYAQNEAWMHLDLSGESDVDLNFWWKEFGDETHAQDGVYFSDNGGTSFVKVQDLNGQSYTNNTWQSFELDLDQLAASNGLSLSATFVVKFQQYDNYPIATDGFAFDDIAVSPIAAPADSVTVTAPNGGESLTAGNVTAISWNSTGSIANVAVEYSTNAGSTWMLVTGSTANDGSYSWTIPNDPTTQGRVRISDATAASVNDISNANFTINSPPTGNYATLPYSTGFESGVLDSFWTTASTSNGRVRVLNSSGPRTGSYHLTMDDPTSGGYAQNEAWLRLDLSAETAVDLTFWWKEFGDETHAQDGIYFSDNDGVSFVKVQDLNGQSYSNQTWTQFVLDVDQLAAVNGLSLSSTFVVKFQQYDNYPIATDGFAFDDIDILAAPGGGGGGAITSETESNDNAASANGGMGNGIGVSGALSASTDDDWFYFDVATAGNVNVVLDINSTADLDWYLYHESDTANWVARGYTTNNPESGTYSCSVARYYLRVDGYQGVTSGYTVTIDGAGLALSAGAPLMPEPTNDPENDSGSAPDVFGR